MTSWHVHPISQHGAAPLPPPAPGDAIRQASPVPYPSQAPPTIAIRPTLLDPQQGLAAYPLPPTSLDGSARASAASPAQREHGFDQPVGRSWTRSMSSSGDTKLEVPEAPPPPPSPPSKRALVHAQCCDVTGQDTKIATDSPSPSPSAPPLSGCRPTCARCHNTIGMDQPRKGLARVWVLQCNHLLDTKCLRAIAEPRLCMSPFSLFLFSSRLFLIRLQ